METQLTAAQIETLQSASKTGGRLMCWPEAVTFAEILDLEAKGLMFHIHYGPNTYGHSDYFLTTEANEKNIAWAHAAMRGGAGVDTTTFVLNKVCGFDIDTAHAIIRGAVRIDYPDAWKEFETQN